MGRRTWRRARRAGRRMRGAAALPPPSTLHPRKRIPYSVLVFTKNATVGAAEGVAALQASAPAGCDVRRDGRRQQVHRCGPRAVQGRRVPEHDRRCPRRRAGGGVREVLPGRRRLPRHRLGDRDRARLGVLHQHPRHARRPARRRPRSRRRSRSPTAVMPRAARCCRSTGRAPTAGTTSPSNVRGVSHVIATVDENTYTGGNTMALHDAADQRPPGRLVQGLPGRALLLHGAAATRPTSFAEATFRKHLGGAVQWAAGKADPVYSDCGATVLANYQQTKISAPPNLNEPIGFDQLPDGRILQTARARPGAPARPGQAARRS